MTNTDIKSVVQSPPLTSNLLSIKQARKPRSYASLKLRLTHSQYLLTYLLTGVKCRATSVAKKTKNQSFAFLVSVIFRKKEACNFKFMLQWNLLCLDIITNKTFQELTRTKNWKRVCYLHQLICHWPNYILGWIPGMLMQNLGWSRAQSAREEDKPKAHWQVCATQLANNLVSQLWFPNFGLPTSRSSKFQISKDKVFILTKLTKSVKPLLTSPLPISGHGTAWKVIISIMCFFDYSGK